MFPQVRNEEMPSRRETEPMSPEEIRIRSLYLFHACSRTIDQVTARLVAAYTSPPPSAQPAVEKSLKRELGLLVRYWAAQQIWERLDASEADAQQLNLSLLRLFTDAFRLPRDGSGLRYAELSTLAEEIQELGRRITTALSVSHRPLLVELEAAMLPCRDAVTTHTTNALQEPLERLLASVKAVDQPLRRPEERA